MYYILIHQYTAVVNFHCNSEPRGISDGLTKVDDGLRWGEKRVPVFRCGRAIGMLCPMHYSSSFINGRKKCWMKRRGAVLVFGLTSEADERSFRPVGITRVMLNFTK